MQARHSNLLTGLGLALSTLVVVEIGSQALASPTCAAALAESAREIRGEARSEMSPAPKFS